MIRALISPTLKKQPDLSYPTNPDILVLTLSKRGETNVVESKTGDFYVDF